MTPTDFLATSLRNSNVAYQGYDIYMRRSTRSIGGGLVKTLDLASIETHESRRGKGNFARVLHHFIDLAKTNDIPVLFVECVLNDELGAYLVRYGMTVQPHSEPPSYYMYVG